MEQYLRQKDYQGFVDKIKTLPTPKKQNGLHTICLCFMTDSQNDDKLFCTDDEALVVIEMIKDFIHIPSLKGDWGNLDTCTWICAMEAGHFRSAQRLMELGYPMKDLLDPQQDYAEAWIKPMALHIHSLSGQKNIQAQNFCLLMLTNAPALGPRMKSIFEWTIRAMNMTMTWRLDYKVTPEIRMDRQNREYPFFLRSLSLAQLNSYMMM